MEYKMKWNLNEMVTQLEIATIDQALSMTQNRTYLAQLLGLNRTTLIAKMRKYGMLLCAYEKKCESNENAALEVKSEMHT